MLDGTVCWAYSNELNVASLPSEPLCIDLGNGCQQSTAMLILSFNTIIIIVTIICFHKQLGARTHNCKYSQC